MFEFLSEALEFENVKVHYSGYRSALLEAIRGAEESIRVTTYVTAFSFKKPTNPVNEVMAALLRKHREKVPVFFILDGPKKGASNFRPSTFFMKYLDGQGVLCAVQQGKPTLHMKMVLIDQRTVFIGSHNLTRASIRNPLDCSVEICKPELVRQIVKRYDQLFQVVSHGKSY